MTDSLALAAPWIFDGEFWVRDAVLMVRDGLVEAVLERHEVAHGTSVTESGAGMLAPGFVDLQVNGGGGVMFNDRPSLESIETICKAHAQFGTTALLATLITDTREITAAAIAAAAEAARRRVPGFLGLHLEGPHLSMARKGAHDARLIRDMSEADQAALIEARKNLPVLLTTVAPESVSPQQIAALAGAGIVVSLGHSDATYDVAVAQTEAGATMVTHLFNAMSQMAGREPGLVGAALARPELFAGLIADGFHVAPASIGIALRAKRGPGRIFLVTDAMATIGTGMTSFRLNGRTIRREGGRLTLEDGTLAGADLDMISAVRFMHRTVGIELSEALRMASLYPAEAVGQAARLGRFVSGAAANIVALSANLDMRGVWIEGRRAFVAAEED